VADNVNDGPHALGGNRKLWRFALDPAGRSERDSCVSLFDWGTDQGPDGITIDDQDRLWVAAGFSFGKPPVETTEPYRAGIYVIAPNGGLLDFHPVPIDMATNCTFGGPDRRTLYITAGHKLWSMRVKDPGVVPALPPLPTAESP